MELEEITYEPSLHCITDDICWLLMQKNEAYGDSVRNTYEKYGLIAFLIRMEDKINRLRTLVMNQNINSNDEKIEDTLRDLAGYAILAIKQLKEDVKESGLVSYAEAELDRLLDKAREEDEESFQMQKMFNDGVLDVVKAFSNGGHSGLSAQVAIEALDRLLRYRPLTQLTFEDDEWTEVTEGVYQNRRADNVFKQADRFDGKPYCIDGPNGEFVSLEEYPLAYLGNFEKPKKEKDKSKMTEGDK